MNNIKRLAAALSIAFAVTGNHAAMAAPAKGPVKNIVLVHGYFADGSGWRGVADILTRDGFNVTVVQQPETTLPTTSRRLHAPSTPWTVAASWSATVMAAW